jgi:putative transposase
MVNNFNTDQGSQFTSAAFTGLLQTRGIQISMDGRGRCHDNIFVERLWRTVKYECIYLNAFEDGRHRREVLDRYFDGHNQERPHTALNGASSDTRYFVNVNYPPLMA